MNTETATQPSFKPRTFKDRLHDFGTRLVMSVGVFFEDISKLFIQSSRYKLMVGLVIAIQVFGAWLALYAGAPTWAAWIFGGIILVYAALLAAMLVSFTILIAFYAYSLWDRAGKEESDV